MKNPNQGDRSDYGKAADFGDSLLDRAAHFLKNVRAHFVKNQVGMLKTTRTARYRMKKTSQPKKDWDDKSEDKTPTVMDTTRITPKKSLSVLLIQA